MNQANLFGRRPPVFSEPTFLMCSPKLYEVDYVINPWMAGNVHCASRERASAQWDVLYRELKRVANVLLVEPRPGWPDMVFTANAGLVWNGTAAVSRFFHPERQGEEVYFRQWFSESGFAVTDLPVDVHFEGEGDALFEPEGARLWAGHGVRTARSSHERLAALWGVEVISLRLVDLRFYHLDTCLCPLKGGYMMYFPAAFDAESLRRIEARYSQDRRILVSEADAVRFACNAINVGRTILLNEISSELLHRLQSLGYTVIQVQLSEFLKAGGAAKCLVLRLSEMEATHLTAPTPLYAPLENTPRSQNPFLGL